MKPIEFTVAEYKLRYTPLAALPLAEEYDRLLKWMDVDPQHPERGTGLLDTLAFSFGEDDHAAMFSTAPDASTLLLWLKTFATLLSNTTLADVVRYYLALGRVEFAVMVGDSEQWVEFQSDERINSLPPKVMFAATWQVLRGLLLPFVDDLQSLFGKAKAPSSGSATSPSEATSELPAPT